MRHVIVVGSSGVLICCEPEMKKVDPALIANFLTAFRMFSQEAFGEVVTRAKIGRHELLIRDVLGGKAYVVLISPIADERLLERVSIAVERALVEEEKAGRLSTGIIVEETTESVRQAIRKALKDTPPWGAVVELYRKIIPYVPKPYSPLPQQWAEEREKDHKRYAKALWRGVKRAERGKRSLKHARRVVDAMAGRDFERAFREACKSGSLAQLLYTYVTLAAVRGFIPSEVPSLVQRLPELYRVYIEMDYSYHFGDICAEVSHSRLAGVTREIASRARSDSFEGLEALALLFPPSVRAPKIVYEFVPEAERRLVEKFTLLYEAYTDVLQSKERYREKLVRVLEGFVELVDFIPRDEYERRIHVLAYSVALSRITAVLEDFTLSEALLTEFAERLLKAWKKLDKECLIKTTSIHRKLMLARGLYTLSLVLDDHYDVFVEILRLVSPYSAQFVLQERGRMILLDATSLILSSASLVTRRNMKDETLKAWLSLFPIVSEVNANRLLTSKSSKNREFGVWLSACIALTSLYLLSEGEIKERAWQVTEVLMDSLRERGLRPWILEKELELLRHTEKE